MILSLIELLNSMLLSYLTEGHKKSNVLTLLFYLYYPNIIVFFHIIFMKIYLISSEINDTILYKIGITRNDVIKRLKQLKTGNAAEMKVVEVFESKWAFKIETNLHITYRNYCIRGEWFNLNKSEVINFVEKCKKLHNTFEILSNNNTWFIDKFNR